MEDHGLEIGHVYYWDNGNILMIYRSRYYGKGIFLYGFEIKSMKVVDFNYYITTVQNSHMRFFLWDALKELTYIGEL